MSTEAKQCPQCLFVKPVHEFAHDATACRQCGYDNKLAWNHMFRAEVRARFITVPARDEARAKALGARWDAVAKTWVVPAALDITCFAEWKPAKATRKPYKPAAASASPKNAVTCTTTANLIVVRVIPRGVSSANTKRKRKW